MSPERSVPLDDRGLVIERFGDYLKTTLKANYPAEDVLGMAAVVLVETDTGLYGVHEINGYDAARVFALITLLVDELKAPEFSINEAMMALLLQLRDELGEIVISEFSRRWGSKQEEGA